MKELYIYSINKIIYLGIKLIIQGRFLLDFLIVIAGFSFLFGLFWSTTPAVNYTLSGKGQGGEAAEEAKEQRANGRAAQAEISANRRTRYFSQCHDTMSLT